MKIGVLLTCHNRKGLTLKCLDNLFACDVPNEVILDVFLVDDGSSDGTSEAVAQNFPNVSVIQGSGELFWNQGMRLAWQTAENTSDCDFYLWLNDDTVLDLDVLHKLLQCHQETLTKKGKQAIIVGACRKSENNDQFSYGGRSDKGPIVPDGTIQECKFINGNVVLIPKQIHKQIGILSNEYLHRFGDVDYGLRAIENGFLCCTTKDFIASCPTNPIGWKNPDVALYKRWRSLYAVTGFSLKEFLIFHRRHGQENLLRTLLKIHLKLIFPKSYHRVYHYFKGGSKRTLRASRVG